MIPPSRASMLQSFLVGGLLPVVVFTIVESIHGTKGGLIAGVLFGAGELAYEYIRFKKVQWITIVGNALVILLGALSLFEENTTLFKLQPAILIFLMAILLLGSSAIKKPFLVELSKKQMPNLPELAKRRLAGMNIRMGFCFIALGVLSVHAAYAWSTAAWAFLKGFGTPLALALYIGAEVLYIRLQNRRRR